MHNLLFLTAANEPYEDFVPLYIASALWSVGDAVVEIGLVSKDDWYRKNSQVTDILETYFKGRFLLRDMPWNDKNGAIVPNTVRFLNEPQTQAKYVYIGDIDIIYLDSDIEKQCTDFMARSGLPYANMFRKGTERLTGLHFSTWEGLYPLPDLTDINMAAMNDEAVLGQIVFRKGYGRPTEHFRPVPGIHVSPNRAALPGLDANGNPRLHWGITTWRIPYQAFRTSDIFQSLHPLLKGPAKDAIRIIDDALSDLEKKTH
jgi:hypothetical protein